MYHEVETKYDAENIDLSKFSSTCRQLKPKKTIRVSSYDHYYTSNKKSLRYREGARPQITMKKKLSKGNNFKRVEVNLDISKHTPKSTVDKLFEMLGYKPNFTIFKDSTIYDYGLFNTVYYIVYTNENRKKELGRFIEIEMSEEHPWCGVKEAWELLQKVEKDFKDLGLTPTTRLSKSLFEMYKN